MPFVEDICVTTARRQYLFPVLLLGKTTFTLRLSQALTAHGRRGYHVSLDDYYNISQLQFDRDGRPDFESIDTLDIERAAQDIKSIVEGKRL